jgi:hypothetical protein
MKKGGAQLFDGDMSLPEHNPSLVNKSKEESTTYCTSDQA